MCVKVALERFSRGFDQVRVTDDPSLGGGRPGGKAGPPCEQEIAALEDQMEQVTKEMEAALRARGMEPGDRIGDVLYRRVRESLPDASPAR